MAHDWKRSKEIMFIKNLPPKYCEWNYFLSNSTCSILKTKERTEYISTMQKIVINFL